MQTRSQTDVRVEELPDRVLERLQSHLLTDPPVIDLHLALPHMRTLAADGSVLCEGLRVAHPTQADLVGMCRLIDRDLQSAYAGTCYRDIIVAEHNAAVFRSLYRGRAPTLRHSRAVRVTGGSFAVTGLLDELDRAHAGKQLTWTPRSGLLQTDSGLIVRVCNMSRRRHDWT